MSIFTHIISTEHSGSSAFGTVHDYLTELVLQSKKSGDENLVLILADHFSMTNLITFYHECTNKTKLNNKIKPVMGLKITVQADKKVDFIHSDGVFFIDKKEMLIIEEEQGFYSFILDGCSVLYRDDGLSFEILKGKKVIIDANNKITDVGLNLIANFDAKKIKKPLFVEDHDLIVVAKGETGRKNINNLVSAGHKITILSDYKKVTISELKKFSDDLICISGGKYGALECSCKEKSDKKLKEMLSVFLSIFKKEEFFLQIQRVENTILGQQREEHIISCFSSLVADNGPFLFACNDVRFPKKRNFKHVIVRKKAMEKKEMYDPSDLIDISKEQYLKSTNEMIHLFKDQLESIVNTVKLTDLTDQSDYKNKLYKSLLPNFDIPDAFSKLELIPKHILDMKDSQEKEKEIIDFNSSAYLKRLSMDGLKSRWDLICKNQNLYVGKIEIKNKKRVTEKLIADLYAVYKGQIELELEVIHRTGFPGYFLIVQDVVNWCKNNDIPVGPGRGSGAGSIVLYCLGITNIDSIEYDLLFERFLNPERVGEPDIDLDFSPRRRKLVIKYMAKKYGIEKTAQILTYGTMAAKDVVDNVGRVYGLQPDERNKIKDLISKEIGIKLSDELDCDTGNERLLALKYSCKQINSILNTALELEGTVKSYGRHAGGVVISCGDMNSSAGLYQESREQGVTDNKSLLSKMNKDDILVPTVQIDKNLCETVGLIKFDFLGLKNLDIIDDCIKFLNNNAKGMENFKIENISPHDKKSLSIFKDADTYGIFQFESPAMRRLMKELRPEVFSEIIALVALFRPGPLQSGMTSSFVDRKHGREPLTYPHKDLSNLLKETYGTIIYQEQVMSVSRILASFTRGEADTLRKAMGKKIIELMQTMRKLFAEGSGHNYCESIKKRTKERWLSVVEPTKKIEININLSDMTFPFVQKLFEKKQKAHIEKNIIKFGFNGLFIDTKEQVILILKEYADLTSCEAELLNDEIDLMKEGCFLSSYRSRMTSIGIKKLESKGLSAVASEVVICRLLVACSVFVRFNVIFSTMNEFAAYGFNKSHSVAYATISMQTAFLKVHYPSQYMASLLSNDSDIERLSVTLRECRRMNIKVLRPDINKSILSFVAESGLKTENKIRFGIGSIKGIATKAQPIIDRSLAFGKINDIYDFYKAFANYKTVEIVKKKGIVKEQVSIVVGKSVFAALLNSGALDSLCPLKNSSYRAMLLSTYQHIEDTFSDLSKRFSRNFREIKKKINAKTNKITYCDLLNSIDDKYVEFKNKDMSKIDFFKLLEHKMIPDVTDYDLDFMFEVYKKADLIFSSNVIEYSIKDLFDDFSIVLNGSKFSLNENCDMAKDAFDFVLKKSLRLSINMFIVMIKSNLAKLDKSIKKFEKILSKKTIKNKEKKETESSLSAIKKSNYYIFSLFLNDALTDIKSISCRDKKVADALDRLHGITKNKQIKFVPIFSINEELSETHTGEDLNIIKMEVNNKWRSYVVPSSKEIEIAPYRNTKERCLKEFAVTGTHMTSHPAQIKEMRNNISQAGFNNTDLKDILICVKTKGIPSNYNSEKHYLKSKVSGVVLEMTDYRMFNKKTNRMETKISLIIDDGTGSMSIRFVAEEMFSSGREDRGIEMLYSIKESKTDVLLFEGDATEGGYDSEGAIMYAKKIGSTNDSIYLPLEQPELNFKKSIEVFPASKMQLSFVRNLLSKNKKDISEVLDFYGLSCFEDLSKDQAGELIVIYKP